MAKDPRDRPASAALFRRDVETAGSAFLGPAWRERGRALLAAGVAERLLDPAPSLLPVAELVDEDDGAPVSGVVIDTASDEKPPGGVGWKVWAVAGGAVLVLIVAMIAVFTALGGSGVQLSPSSPAAAAPLFTPSVAPTDNGAPTDAATAAPDSPTPTVAATPTPTPTLAPNTSPVTLAPTPVPTPTPVATPSPSPT